MTLNNKYILMLLFVLSINILFCQTKTNEIKQTKSIDSSYFSLSVNFINDAIFLGRKDSITVPYLFPSFTYFNKTGLYAKGSFSYLTKSNEARVDVFLGSVGYQMNLEKFRGDISVTKYFFSADSYNVISEVEADLAVSAGYDFDIADIVLSLTSFLNSNSNSDIILSTEISHNFISKNKNFQISPTFGIFFASQNFYEEYYLKNRFGSGRNKGAAGGQGNGGGTDMSTSNTIVVLEESEKFDLMAVEFSLPIWYINTPFVVSLLPVYIMPQNPATLTVNSQVYKEHLENTFYWVLGLNYIF